jgi:hypothetical protein
MIYLIRMRGTNYVKIGIAENPKKRLSTLASGNPMPLELVFSVATKEGAFSFEDEQVEKEVHEELAGYHVRGEWFDLTEAQVISIVTVLTDRFQYRPIWNQWRERHPPFGYIEPFRPRSLLAHV